MLKVFLTQLWAMYSTHWWYWCHFLCYLLNVRTFHAYVNCFYSVIISLCSFFFTFDASKDSWWYLSFFPNSHISLSFLCAYCMKWRRVVTKFPQLILRDFCAVLHRELLSLYFHCHYSGLCCVCRWDILLPSTSRGLGTRVEFLVLVLSQRCFCLWPIFLLNTTCNCIFMWNSAMPLQAPCVGVYANDGTRNELLVGLRFFGFFFFFPRF